jgi:hypothetical protein
MSPNPISRQRRFSFGGVMRRWSNGSGQFSLITIDMPDVAENFQPVGIQRFFRKKDRRQKFLTRKDRTNIIRKYNFLEAFL